MSRRPTRPRRVLVCGGGGVLGFAWTVGALTAVTELLWPGRQDVDVVIGTSAGSVLAALLAAGLPVDGIRRHHQGVPLPSDPLIEWDYEQGAGGALPPRPGLLPGSLQLAWAGLRHPQRIRPVVALAGLMPRGRASLAPVQAMVDGLRPHERGWPRRPRPWIVATDYRSGERVVFGLDAVDSPRPREHRLARPGGTPRLGEAVAASCAIPGWYAPVAIGGRPYIDGGTASNTSLDLLLDPVLGERLEQVVVLAPMAATDPDRPRLPAHRVERSIRRAITASLRSDVAALRARDVDVLLITPSPADLTLIGANMMNSRRRTQVLDSAALSAARQIRAHYGRAAPGRPPRSTHDATGWGSSASTPA